MLAFSLNSISQNYIGTHGSSAPGNIYHTGGNLGVGTTTPHKSIHIFEDYPNSASIRLQTDYTVVNTCNWDIENAKTTLKFNFSLGEGINTIKTRFSIDSLGRIVVNSLNSAGAVPDISAILDLQSTTMGMLTPRMTNIQIEAITNPSQGLLVYSTDENIFKYYNDASWQTIPNLSQINSQLANYLLIDDFNNHPTSQVTQQNIDDWNTAHTWGNHADNGYITASSVDELTNKSGNISMWTNDAGYITDANIPNLIWQQNSSGINYNSGFVGIGTDEPAKQLHIVTENENSTIRLTNIITNKGTNPPTPIASSFWDIKNDNGKLVFSQGANPAVTISGGGTINAQKFIGDGSQLTNLPFPEAIWQQSNDVAFYDGTVNAQKFIGDGSQLTNLPFPETIWQQSDDIVFYNNGYVGIGTAEPNAPLHIYGIDPDITLDVEPNKGLNAQINFATGGVNMANLNYNRNNHTLVLANDGNKLVLDNAGNVGIGTTTPEEKLEVNGGVKSSFISITNDNANTWTDIDWAKSIVTPVKSSWVTSTKVSQKDYYLGMGMGNRGWYFIEGKDDGSVIYPFIVDLDGNMFAQSLELTVISWPDFVFDANYDLMSIDSLNQYIQNNNHLPDIPSEQEIINNGLNVGQMQNLQMQKIEELTLYIIDLQQEINTLKQDINQLKSE